MADATLTLAGRSELVVRMALISYQADLAKIKKKEEEAGIDTAGTDELLDETKDILGQLGWTPKDNTKARAEVTRGDPAQIDFTSPPATPPKPAGPKVFSVKCLSCTQEFQARGTEAECPHCGEKFGVLADENGEIVRLVRQKKPKGDASA